MILRILVAGISAPQGSKTRFPNGGMAESSKAVGPWREAVRAETQRALDFDGLTGTGSWPVSYPGAVYVALLFVMPRPGSHYGTGRNAGRLRESAPARPKVKPDLDKLERAVLDGITQGGAIKDDCQVADVAKSKVYADGLLPGVQITICPADPHVPLVAPVGLELGPVQPGDEYGFADYGPGFARFGADDTPADIDRKMRAALGPAKALLEEINSGAAGHVAELRLGGRDPGLYGRDGGRVG